MRFAGKSLSLVLLLAAAATIAHSQVILGPTGGGSTGSGGPGNSSRNSDVVAHVTCMGNNGGTINVPVTGYTVDLQHASAGQASGSGAGKVTTSQMEAEVPVSEYVASAVDLYTGQGFSSCELRTVHAGGLVLTFKRVGFSEVNLAAGMGNSLDVEEGSEGTPVVRLVMVYEGLQLMSGGQGSTEITIIAPPNGGTPIGAK